VELIRNHPDYEVQIGLSSTYIGKEELILAVALGSDQQVNLSQERHGIFKSLGVEAVTELLLEAGEMMSLTPESVENLDFESLIRTGTSESVGDSENVCKTRHDDSENVSRRRVSFVSSRALHTPWNTGSTLPRLRINATGWACMCGATPLHVSVQPKLKEEDGEAGIHYVAYSSHSSYPELVTFIEALP